MNFMNWFTLGTMILCAVIAAAAGVGGLFFFVALAKKWLREKGEFSARASEACLGVVMFGLFCIFLGLALAIACVIFSGQWRK